MEQIENLLSPPDWFPETHPPAPGIIVKGHAGALACGSCHLMNGLGHPESADVSGFTAAYIEQQMMDFKSGVRADYARMNAIAKELSAEEISQASAWFAQLKPARSTRVVEAAMTEVDANRAKLAGAIEVDERHLFVWINPSAIAAHWSLREEALPTDPVDLGDGIDVLWVAGSDMSRRPAFVSRLWRVESNQPWQDWTERVRAD